MPEFPCPDSIDRFLRRVQEAGAETPALSGTPSLETVARRWKELGLRPGDLIILGLPNGTFLLEQFFGALAGGFVPALVAPNTPLARLHELAQLMNARAVGALRLDAVALGAQRQAMNGPLCAALFERDTPPAAHAGEVVLLTSGTSGFASGCVFALEDLLLNAERHADSIGQGPADTVLVSLPLYYSFALVAQMLATLIRGGRLIIDGPPFNAERYFRTMSQFNVTISSLTPIVVRGLLRKPRDFADGPRVLTVGGNVLDPGHVAQLLERRRGRELYLTYGLTQAGPRVSTLAAHSEPPGRFASVGRPIAGTRVELQPVNGDPTSRQLLVTSSTVMKRRIGYTEGNVANDAAATAVPGTIASGDIFEQDADGYLYFRGRLADFIVKNGEKLCLASVRRVAKLLPDVACAKTRTIPSPSGGDDFELTLYTSDSKHDYGKLLQKLLRRNEIPSKLCVEIASPSLITAYK